MKRGRPVSGSVCLLFTEVSITVNARLEYCGNYLELDDFQHDAAAEKSGNPYNCTFDIRVKSGDFAGIADCCEYDYKELQNFIAALEDLIAFRRTEVSLTEISTGRTVHFACDSTGHIRVSGELICDADVQSLRFHFMTDQTVFPAFIRELKCL